MLRFTRFYSGKFKYLVNSAGVKHLTNIMSGLNQHNLSGIGKQHLSCFVWTLIQISYKFKITTLPKQSPYPTPHHHQHKVVLV